VPDVRCLLPSIPVGVITGAAAVMTFVPDAPQARPWLSLSLGAAVAVVVGRAVSQALRNRSERTRRCVGYLGAAVVGLGVAGVLAFGALISGLCASWGEQCSPEEQASVERLWMMAVATPFAVTGLYAFIDLTTLRARRR